MARSAGVAPIQAFLRTPMHVGAALARARGASTEKVSARSSVPLDRDHPSSVPAIHQSLIISGRPQAEPLRARLEGT